MLTPAFALPFYFRLKVNNKLHTLHWRMVCHKKLFNFIKNFTFLILLTTTLNHLLQGWFNNREPVLPFIKWGCRVFAG